MSSQDGEQTTDICKEDFASWSAAVSLHMAGQFQEALQLYHSMRETSARIFYNMAVAYINVGDLGMAEKCLTSAVERDKGLAIAFFQRGTLHLERQDIQRAIVDLESTRMLLRGNIFINYRPLGLFCHLDDFAILYNLALAHLLEGDEDEFHSLMTEATHNADYFQREQISSTLRRFKKKRWSEIQPINVSTEAVFIPPKEITKNLDRRKSSKRSKVVFASNEKDNTPSFRGIQRVDELRKASSPDNRRLTDTRTSMKRKLFRKLKSTGDLNVHGDVQRQRSGYRKRHSSDQESVSSYTERRPSFKSIEQASTSYIEDAVNITDRKVNSIEEIDKAAFKGGKDTGKSSITSNINGDELTSDIEVPCLKSNDIIDGAKVAKEETIDVNTSAMKKSDRPISEGSRDIKTGQVKSPTNYKRRFKRKIKSAGDIKATGKQTQIIARSQASRSAGDLEKVRNKSLLPLQKNKKSQTSLTSLKQLINMGNKRRSPDRSHPTVLMQGCKAAGELLTMFIPVDDTGGNDVQTEPDINKDDADVNNNNVKSVKPEIKSKYSLGSVFGDRSTVVKYALTEACDVLTASITPTINEFEETKYVCRKKKETFKQTHKTAQNDKITTEKSSKTKRAPEPPKSFIRPELFAAGHLLTLTALVHHDFKNVEQYENAENKENLTYNVTGSSPKSSGSGVNSLEPEKGFEKINKHLDTLNIETVNGKNETVSPINVDCFENVNTRFCNKSQADILTTKERVGGECKEAKDKKTEQNYMMQPLSDDNIMPPRKVKLPPPSYPPPPLRPSFWKNRKKKHSKRKQSKSELSGLIGNALLASGKMLGAVADTVHIDDVFDGGTNVITTSWTRKDESCGPNADTVTKPEEDHDYVNVGGIIGKCGVDKDVGTMCLIEAGKLDNADKPCEICGNKYNGSDNICNCTKSKSDVYFDFPVVHSFHQLALEDNIASPAACSCMPKRPTKQPPQTLNKMLINSCGLLTAFVTSNQDIQQAYETFVQDKNNNVSKNDFECFTEDGECEDEHDYVNVSRL